MILTFRSLSTFVFIAIVALVLSGCQGQDKTYETSLTMWGVFDNEDDYHDVTRMYSAAHPYVQRINYRKLSVDTYKDDLLNALAAGNNPDIFMIHSTWLPDFADKIAPAPAQILRGRDVIPIVADVVVRDTIIDDTVMSVAPSLDSLALYYNKDIFNADGITSAPATWEEFDTVVKSLTRTDEEGGIVQSGATFGTANNINRPMDLLTVLMMQNGVEMAREGSIQFDRGTAASRQPGQDALRYYTSFARGDSRVYTWNQAQNYSIDAFAEGRAAMTISYSYHYDTIRAKNEQLNFAVAPLPQIDVDNLGQQVNYPSYWTYAVAKNHDLPAVRPDQAPLTNEGQVWESWQFLKAFAYGGPTTPLTDPFSGDAYTLNFEQDLAVAYLEKTRKPPARKDLIERLKGDVRYDPFVRGNLIARSWERRNADETDQVIADMIAEVNRGESVQRALEVGAQRAQQLMQ